MELPESDRGAHDPMAKRRDAPAARARRPALNPPLAIATTMYREVGMRFWLERPEAEM